MTPLSPPLLHLLFFIAGAGGTTCRLLLSPTIVFGMNRRTVVEVVTGGMLGILVPYFGTFVLNAFGVTVTQEAIASLPPAVKGAGIWLLNFAGSFSVGEFLARRRQKIEANPPTPPAP